MAEVGSILDSSFEDYEENVDNTSKNVSRCDVHDVPSHLYCNKDQKVICGYCFYEHQSHDIVDIGKDRKVKSEVLTSNLNSVRGELHRSKAKIVASKNEVSNRSSDSLLRLKAAKVETIRKLTRKFNKLIKQASQEKASVEDKIGKELDDLDDVLTLIDNIEEGVQKEISPYEDILIKLKAVDTVGNQIKSALSGVRTYQYLEYQMNQMSSFDVDRFCGILSKNEVRIELFEDEKFEDPEKDVEGTDKTIEIPLKRRSRKKRSRRRPKKSAFAYKAHRSLQTGCSSDFSVSLTAGKVVNLCGKEEQWTVKQYDTEKGVEKSSAALKVSPSGLVEVTLAGKPCLALSYSKNKKIDFLNVNDPTTVLYSHSVAPHQPGVLCSASPTTLLYEDQSKTPREVRWLDCSFSRPKASHGTNITYTQQNNIWDMCLLQLFDKELLVTSRGSRGIRVYNVDTDEIVWKIKYGSPCSGLRMNPFGITADERGNLFVCDLDQSCVQIFSVLDKKHIGRLPNDTKVLGQPVMIRWCYDTKSLLVVHKKLNQFYLSMLQY